MATTEPDLLFDNGASPSPASTSSVMLTEPLSEVRQITNGFGQQLPALRTATVIAMVARQSYMDCKRRCISVPTSFSSDLRRYNRHDNVRSDPRQDPEQLPSSSSMSTLTLDDIQKTMANLRSQVDWQTRLARSDDDEHRPRARAYCFQSTSAPADASNEDPPNHTRAFRVRSSPAPADSAADD